MSTVSAIVALSLVALLLGWALWAAPFGSWSFTYGGHTVRVKNYAMRELVELDGVVQPSSRVSGDSMTWAQHAVVLPSGEKLEVKIDSSNGLTPRCRAAVDGVAIYSSEVGDFPTMPATPAPTAVPEDEPDDERWDAARVLLAELSRGSDETAGAAEALRGALKAALINLDAAQASAQAHAALGGSDADLNELIGAREHVVQQLLSLLRELHLAANNVAKEATAVPHVEDELERLAAEREVRAAQRRKT